jgi:hypothetical protein
MVVQFMTSDELPGKGEGKKAYPIRLIVAGLFACGSV